MCFMVWMVWYFFFFFSSRRRHTRCSRDWSSDVLLFRSRESGCRVLGVGCWKPGCRESGCRVLGVGCSSFGFESFSTPFAPPPTPLSCSTPNTPRPRSEEHTSELQSRLHLVCRLLLEKKN